MPKAVLSIVCTQLPGSVPFLPFFICPPFLPSRVPAKFYSKWKNLTLSTMMVEICSFL